MAPKKSTKAASKPKKVATNPLIVPRPKTKGIGQGVQITPDLTHFVRWPQYVRVQRMKSVLKQRLNCPPQLNQFNSALDKNTAAKLMTFLNKYRVESRQEKKARLRSLAEAAADGKTVRQNTPLSVQHGINHVASLVESKQARLVVIAHDVEPIELVVWLPALCRKMDVPYCIIKSKSRLGELAHMKTTSCVAVTDIKDADKPEFAKLVETIKAQFNDRTDIIRRWGGGKLSDKSSVKLDKRAKERELEEKRKAKVLARA
ncbi:hypothetical protein GEMRC1_010648 [Eukaryota sp. GEM-RC1]